MTYLIRGLAISLSTCLLMFGFSLTVNAFPIVSAECRSDAIACAKKGKLDKVSIYGFISKEDRIFFENLDNAITDDLPFPKIYLNSEGGHGKDGMAVGRILRKHKATVVSGSPFFEDHFIECTSACVFIAAGAITRQLDHIGIHQGHLTYYNGPHEWHNDPLTPEMQDEDLKYFDEMGINPEIKDIIKATPSDHMSDFYFEPRADREGQKIIELGFRMLDEPATSLPTMPMFEDDVFKARDDRFKNAIEYGFTSGIPIIVDYALRTPAGKPIDYATANHWLELGVKQGDVWSMYNLGVHYQFGRGSKIDLKKANQLYLQAAKLGMGPAQNNIGWNYYKAIGVRRSIPDAVFWITRAAEHGESFGYGSLCEMHDAGDVFERDDIEAYKWCKLSVDEEPEGHAKMNDVLILSKYRKKLSLDDWNTGETLARNWKPLMKTLYSNGHDTDDE